MLLLKDVKCRMILSASDTDTVHTVYKIQNFSCLVFRVCIIMPSLTDGTRLNFFEMLARVEANALSLDLETLNNFTMMATVI